MSDKKPQGQMFLSSIGCAAFVLAGLLIIVGVLSALVGLFTSYRLAISVGLVCVFAGIVLIKFHNFIFKVPQYTEDDLLTVLNTEWKSAIRLSEELCELKGVGDSFIDDFFRKPNIGWLHVTLDGLQMQQIVERREVLRESPVSTRYPFQAEYRLTMGGLRKKDEVLDRLRNQSGVGTLAPQRS